MKDISTFMPCTLFLACIPLNPACIFVAAFSTSGSFKSISISSSSSLAGAWSYVAASAAGASVGGTSEALGGGVPAAGEASGSCDDWLEIWTQQKLTQYLMENAKFIQNTTSNYNNNNIQNNVEKMQHVIKLSIKCNKMLTLLIIKRNMKRIKWTVNKKK